MVLPSPSHGAPQKRLGSRMPRQRPPRGLQGFILEPFWSHFGSFSLIFALIFAPPGDAFSNVCSHMFPTCALPLSPCFPRSPTQKQRKRRLKNKAKQTQRTRKRERNTSKVRTTVAVTRGSSCLLLLRVRAFRPNADAGNGKRVRRMRTRVKSRVL